MKIKYAINDFQFETSTRKIYITGSKGVMDLPAPKEPFRTNYPFRNGEEVYLGTANKMAFEPRNIELDCVIVASSADQLITDFNDLKAVFTGSDGKKLKRLYIQMDTAYPLIFDVYLNGEITLDKRWSDGQIAGKFTLKLCEPNPIKIALHLTDYEFFVSATKPANLITDSFVNATIASTAGLVTRTVNVTAGKTYTFTTCGFKMDTKNGQVVIRNASSSFIRTITFSTTVEQIQAISFAASTTEQLIIESSCVPSGTPSNRFYTKWHVLSEGGVAATKWTPTASEAVKITIIFRNPTSKKQVINVLCDGKTVSSQSTIVMPSGVVGNLAELALSYQCEYINGFLKNPVITIDNDEVELYSSSKTILKPYAL